MPADDSHNPGPPAGFVARLARLTADLQSALDMPRIAEVIVDHGVAAVGAKTAALWLVESRFVRLVRTVAWTDAAVAHVAAVPLDLDAPLCASIRDRAMIHFASWDDYAQRYPESAARAKDFDHPSGAMVCIPVTRGGEAIAAILFMWSEAHAVDAPERDYLSFLALHVGEAIERARLFQSEKLARRRFELLYGLVDAIARAESLVAVFEHALDAVCRGLDVERSSILLFDESDEMRFAAWRGLSQTYRNAVDGHSPWKKSDSDAKPLFYEDVEHDEAMAAYRDAFASEGIRALGFVPLVHERALIGKFMVYASSPRVFGRDDVAMATALAKALATAVVRRSALDEVERTRDVALATARARADIVAVVAHDLRNPLNVAKMKMQILEMKAKDDAAKKDFALVTRNLDHMNRLIGGLLEAATIEAGLIELHHAPLVVSDVANEAVDLLRSLAEKKNVTLVATPAPAIALCDRQRILQVLSNLVGNAIRFAPPETSVAIEVALERDQVRVSVSDDGPGIPEEDRERVFERFVHGASRPGVGLGLYIARGIVNAHGGRIWIDPAAARGTRVSFTLPRA